MTNRFIRKAEAASRFVGCCERTLDRMIKDGRIMPPTHISPHIVGWPEEQLQQWLNEHVSSAREAVCAK